MISDKVGGLAMGRTEGYEIIFITSDGHPGTYTVARPDAEAEKAHLKAKHGNIAIKSWRALDANALKDLNLGPGESTEWISPDFVKSGPERS
jgi:hypothetical protein